eukprot:TRINITY_DN86833_c0_g1_i1.p3 TRINITY_DN86833_c0_g1~~TRINITY_DN86833_c0_g1_i1.p3  ORF type:complete len:276 (-),score=154.22 TRINITY_DN86833_c0_g1_i1:55-882(-)
MSTSTTTELKQQHADNYQRVALVTGGSSGIGYGAALELLKDGVNVVITARGKERLHKAVEDLRAAVSSVKGAGEVHGVVADVTKKEDSQRAVQETIKKFGALHIAFNNAGVFVGGKQLHEVSEEDIDTVFNINQRGILYSLRAEVPELLKEAEKGRDTVIINNSSVLGGIVNERLSPTAGLYSASKAWVNSITQTAALEYAGKIRVLAVLPGIVATAINEKLPSDVFKQLVSGNHVIPRAGVPSDIGHLVAFLASSKASFFTGSLINADAGIALK